MTDSADIHITTVDAGSAGARGALAHYFAELDRRLTGGFTVDAALDEATSSFNPPAGLFVIATSADEVVGCGALYWFDATTAEVKRMWVDAKVRGIGLGRRVLGHLEDEARRAGCQRVVLDTNEALVEAIAMYRALGYREIEPYNDNPDAHHWFEKLLA